MWPLGGKPWEKERSFSYRNGNHSNHGPECEKSWASIVLEVLGGVQFAGSPGNVGVFGDLNLIALEEKKVKSAVLGQGGKNGKAEYVHEVFCVE